ncbi:MAG: MFS transporter [Gammaproteobacteria bacterium]|nr:MFS transporter [Gammaproteobacteria bacterium]
MNPDRSLTPNVRLLLAARAIRSLGQGVTVASFTLYLHALGYTGGEIGSVLMAGLSFGVLLTLIVGPLSDRRGRRGLLLMYEAAAAAAAFAAMVSTSEAVLIAAATVAGFGRGANGSAGPFAPVEQSWLARELDGEARTRAFSLNATLGFLGMAAGCALVAVPALFGRRFADLESYRLLFAVPLCGSLAAIALLSVACEPAAAPAIPAGAGALRADALITIAENRQLRRLAFTNSINGFAIGTIGPLMAYWFSRRYGEGAAMIGPALAASFLFAAGGSILGGMLSLRIGAVNAVVRMRIAGLAALIAVPLAPLFGEAAGLYAVRAAFNQGTAGTRQSIAAGLTRPQRRGLAASVQMLSLQIPRALGPVLGGWLIHAGRFTVPFLIATLLQALYLYLYRHYFGPDDRAPRRPGMIGGAA